MPGPLDALKNAFPPNKLSQDILTGMSGSPAPTGSTDVDALIKQREAINAAMSGKPPAPAPTSAYPGQPKGWHPPMAPGVLPEPWDGAMKGLAGAAPPAESPMAFDELMKRAQAIR